MFRSSAALALVLTSLVAGCSDTATVPEDKGFGASPTLPAPRESFIPTVNIATAGTWPAGDKPKAAPGLAVNAFADGLQHPRTVLSLPNGDVLVAESDAPPKPDDAKGIRGWVMTKVMAKAGSGKPSADRISILRDADKDGVAELRQPFIETISSPFGMALAGSVLYVAATDALWRFPYREGDLKPAGAGVKVADLPAGTINHHWTKDLTVSPDGRKLYVSVGSNSNAAENGIEAEARRAGILEIDAETGASRVFASGLRNPNGLTWQPQSGALWTVVNERDELGSDLVPDYMTAVQEGGFYGWPYSYFGQHVDTRVTPQRPDLVAKALVPDYALGAHTASLGLTFYTADLLPEKYRNGAFVGQHGSWNRKPRSGYKVIFVPFMDGRPSGAPEDILSGFVTEEGTAKGRPVGVATAKDGALLVADDVGNRIWRVTPAR